MCATVHDLKGHLYKTSFGLHQVSSRILPLLMYLQAHGCYCFEKENVNNVVVA